jgi:mRNA-degrading endonuclease RelE of RelBE toxin-antitoxin system
MGDSIEIISKAEREFLKLPETIQKQIRRQILSLENNPNPANGHLETNLIK